MPPQQPRDDELEESSSLRHLQEPLLVLGDNECDDEEENRDLQITNTTITTTTSCTSLLNGNGGSASTNYYSSCGKTVALNHNVFLNLVMAVVYGISGSLWNGTAYAAYLKQLGHDSNTPLGDIEAVGGIATLLTALPVGYLADRFGRSPVIRAGGMLWLFTAVLQMIVLEWIGTDSSSTNSAHLWILGFIMALWGVGDGVVNGPCAALFADSTPEGERSTYYNYLFICFMVASAAGPLLSIVLFQIWGDEWDLYDLRKVIYVGLGMELLNGIIMMQYDDSKALVEDDDQQPCQSHNNNNREGQQGETDEQEGEIVAGDEDDNDELEREQSDELTPLQKRQRYIPYIIFLFDLIVAIGSGMTVKFFPLFFKDEVGLSPSQVQVIYLTVPLALACTSTLGSKVLVNYLGFGRVQTTLLFSSLGVSCLYAMVFFKSYLDKHPFVLVPIYILRTSLVNAGYPLQESILMDFVPKDERARWKSLDSVAAFGWCGSAAFGGWISDRYDYTQTFLITAIVQSVGVGIWCLLLPLVPRQEGSTRRTTTSEQEAEEHQDETTTTMILGSTVTESSNGDENSLTQLLLSE